MLPMGVLSTYRSGNGPQSFWQVSHQFKFCCLVAESQHAPTTPRAVHWLLENELGIEYWPAFQSLCVTISISIIGPLASISLWWLKAGWASGELCAVDQTND